MDVLVYPRISTRNTELVTPLKPLEAMVMGKAVLGSDVGGVRELIVEGTGLMYRSGDTQDLAEKCLQLIADAQLRSEFGQHARRHVLDSRDWKNIAAQYEHPYTFAARRRVFATVSSEVGCEEQIQPLSAGSK
jgi:glycosyltransferase involved in cell wall biosynthesis